MPRTKDGFYKEKGILDNSYVLLASGGHQRIGNESGYIPLSNSSLNTDLNADMIDGKHLNELFESFTSSNNDTVITIGGVTKIQQIDAASLNSYNDSYFFRYRGNISSQYVDLLSYADGASNYINPRNGIWNVNRNDHYDELITFTDNDTLSGLDLYFSYERGSDLKIRRRINGGRVSGEWENIITDVNISPSLLINNRTVASQVGGVTSQYIIIPYSEISQYSYSSLMSYTSYSGVTDSGDVRGHWNTTIENIEQYYDGLCIHVKLNTTYYGNNEEYNTLNVNNIGAKLVWIPLNDNLIPLTSEFGYGAELILTYRSNIGKSYTIPSTTGVISKNSIITDGWVIHAQYNTNDNYLAGQYYFRYKVNNNGYVGKNTLIVKCPDGTVTSLTKTNDSTNTSKTMYNGPIILDNIFYNASENSFTANSIINEDLIIYENYSYVDARYTFNCGSTLVANQPFFIVVNQNETDGYFYLDSIQPWQVGIPSIDNNNKIYIYVGVCYDDHMISLEIINKPYIKKDGIFKQYGFNEEVHYVTSTYIGEQNTQANADVKNPFIKLFDNDILRNQYQISGGGATTVSTDANGNITISSIDTNTDTHWNSYIKLGYSDTLVNNITTNGYTYLKLIENDLVTNNPLKIVGTGIVDVSTDENGVLTIDAVAPTDHYTTYAYIGTIDAKANADTTNPYFKLFDNDFLRNQYRISGGGATTVSSDANGNITISSIDTNTDTHWSSYIRLGYIDTLVNNITTNGNTYLKLIENDLVTSNPIKIVGAGIVDVTTDEDGVLTITGTALTEHYITYAYIGAIDAQVNADVQNPYLKIFDDNILRNQYQISGGGITTVSSDANGNITISTPDTNVDTHWSSYIKLGYSDTLVNNITTNGNTYLKLIENDTLRDTSIKIIGTGIVDVSTDENGVLTIDAVAPPDHYVTYAYIGTIDSKANADVQNPYFKLFDDNFLRNQYQISGDGITTVSSDTNGNIIISTPDTNVDTHWSSYIKLGYVDTLINNITTNGNTYLKLIENNLITNNPLKIVGTGIVEVSSDENGVLTIDAIAPTDHYTTYAYIGAIDAKANADTTNPYFKLFDNDFIRNQYQISGDGITTVSSDANGNITISTPDTNVDTHWSSYIRLGYIDTLVNNITTNGNTYLKLIENDLVTSNPIKIVGTGIVDVSTDENGVLTINAVAPTDHYTTYSYIGAIDTQMNADVQNPYFKIFDNNILRSQHHILGAGSTTVSSDTDGNITISSTYTDTHWNSYIRLGAIDTTSNEVTTNGNTYLKLIENDLVTNNPLKIVGTGIVEVSSDKNGILTINAIAPTDHYTTGLYVGAINAYSNTNVSNPYIKLFDDNTLRNQYQIIAGTGISIESDTNGNITIANTHSDVYTILEFTRNLKVTEAWMDTGIVINSTNFPDGSGAYVVLIDATSLSGTNETASLYTGVMTIYTYATTGNGTNTNGHDEIILHGASAENTKRLFLRITQQSSSNYKLEIAASAEFSDTKQLIFKFRKLI